MTRPYVVEDGHAGRPKTEINPEPPPGFSLHDPLMEKLDKRGWYRQLAERQRYEEMDGDPHHREFNLRQVTDPEEIDRFMCRAHVVAEVNTLDQLEGALFNGRIVIEIDPVAPKKVLFKQIAALLDDVVSRTGRQISTKAWKDHRILALYDLKLMSYDLSSERKQLAAWLFPEIDDEKKRGDKFDRAKEYLDTALSSLPALRAQSHG